MNTACRELVLIGGGGHAIVVAEAAMQAGWKVTGFFDDAPDASVLPTIDRLGALNQAASIQEGAAGIVAVGDIHLRRRIIEDNQLASATVIHPSAWVSPSAEVAEGVFVGAGTIIQGRARIGAHAIINTGAIVEHDCIVGENCHIAPRVALGGGVHVGRDTLIGIGACAIPGVSIGACGTVGAGSVVIRDVDDGQTVVGVPALPIGALRSV